MTMRFMMIIKSDADIESGRLPSEAELTAMGKYNDEVIKAGAMLAGEGLKASKHGARVRIERGKTRVIDGPFAEAKELVAGYWIIQAKDTAEAVAWARKVPLPEGEIEVRPLYEAEDFAADAAGKQETAARAEPPPARQPGTRRYALLLKADRFTEAGGQPTPKLLEEMGALMAEMTAKGAVLAGEGLKPTSVGARVHHAGGKTKVIDGPFTEAKEIVAGFCLAQTRTRDEAIEFARRMLQIHIDGTGGESGEVEVREVFELEDFPVSPEEKPDGWRAKEQAFRDEHGQ
jgi:hypothetical protein